MAAGVSSRSELLKSIQGVGPEQICSYRINSSVACCRRSFMFATREFETAAAATGAVTTRSWPQVRSPQTQVQVPTLSVDELSDAEFHRATCKTYPNRSGLLMHSGACCGVRGVQEGTRTTSWTRQKQVPCVPRHNAHLHHRPH